MKILDQTNIDWNTIQQFFEMDENLQESFLTKIENQKNDSNLSFLELLKNDIDFSNLTFEDGKTKINESTFQDKKEIEKTHRYQSYIALNYFFNNNNYFDYFSYDSFNILKNSKLLLHEQKKEIVSSEFLLFSFISSESELTNLLNEFGLDNNFLELHFLKTKQKEEKKSLTIFKKWKEIFLQKKEIFKVSFERFLQPINSSQEIEKEKNSLILNTIPFSNEVYALFEKAIEKAIFYKSPIITEEILFLSLLENEKTSCFNLIKKVLKNPTQKILLRYKLLKLIHSQEAIIRNSVSKNQHFFAYLLKTELSSKDFRKLIDTKKLKDAVNIFRNKLICQTVPIKLEEFLEKEIFTSSKANKIRNYSS